MTMYERIEKLRKDRGISQGKLEKELGFSNGSISKWKNSSPTPERLKKLADYFEVSVEYLMTGVKEHTDYIITKKDEDTGEEYCISIEVMRAVQQISENDKAIIDVYLGKYKDRLVAYAEKLKALEDMEEEI